MSNISDRENMLLVLDGDQPAWVPNYSREIANIGIPLFRRTKDTVTGYNIDFFGVEFTSTVDGPIPAHTKNLQFRLTDITKWRDIMPKVEYDTINWEEQSHDSYDKAACFYGKLDHKDKVFNLSLGGIWDELHYIMGFEGALLALAEEPAETYNFLMAIADMYIEVLRRQSKYFRPDLVTIMDHISNKKDLMMSPKTYRELIKPAQKKVFEAAIELGCRAQMHVDGYVEPVIPDYAEIGVSVIQPFQVFNDIEKAKRDYGIVCIGGWDAFGPGNQQEADEETVRQSVRLAIDTYGPTGKYVFWCSGATDRNPEQLLWLNDEADKYGHAFYQK
ncbi:uroporphyrinogen decarboxylase (URO-D) [Oxobacter pfennigii]|uniref:Uroporphyrinogen decarboxylase (URO-D) n=1 Tax=Oxobacter pfennigii TaxID=36849 RepID=A0A0P8W5F7_9CLOT|nr:uroporphyrinogen decarboxylase family protein [Oxobacter pfennigii]KPU43157.1 uroporphyrinogen decarboxylase (URO-D) [Oxobacter pfennigii]